MSEFVDRLMLQFRDPAAVVGALVPPGEAPPTRMQQLLTAAYDLPYAKFHGIRDVTVLHSEFQRPLFPPSKVQGTWMQTVPNYARTEVVYDGVQPPTPLWLDLALEVEAQLLLEVDPGEVESILMQDIAGFNSLNDFRARFRFIDLDAFMAEHHITTVEELREAYHYLTAQIRLKALKPFDPNDPANLYRFTLQIGVFLRDLIDLTSLLREIKLARLTLERSVVYPADVGQAEVRTPYAPLLILPTSALTVVLTADALHAFFALEGILVLFMTPT
jgi:hypothetical protein